MEPGFVNLVLAQHVNKQIPNAVNKFEYKISSQKQSNNLTGLH